MSSLTREMFRKYILGVEVVKFQITYRDVKLDMQVLIVNSVPDLLSTLENIDQEWGVLVAVIRLPD